jgi:lysophospholipase L1-like esterase
VDVLILGDSNTTGVRGGPPWPELVRDSLERKLSQPVTLRSSRLWVTGPQAAGFVKKQLAEGHPDVVIVAVGTYVFTARTVENRVRRLFGNRAARWYKSLERSFERRTAGKSAGRDRANRASRRVLRHVIGAAPFANREDVAAGYEAVFRTLARGEHIDVIVMTYPGGGAHSQTAEARRERALFFPPVRAAADGHRFSWVDGAEVFAGTADLAALHVDDVHYGQEGQAMFARAMESAILERIASRA